MERTTTVLDGKIDENDDLSGGDMLIGAVCYGAPDGECATAE